jgi:hypothetical protein
MKKYWLLLAAGLLTAAFAVGVVACDDDEDDGSSGDTTATEPADGDEATEPADDDEPTATAENLDLDEVEVPLEAVGAATATGAANLLANDAGGTDVAVTVSAGLEPGSHLSHIHTGTCAAQGGVEYPLTNVEADAQGAGTADTTLDVALADLQDGAHYVQVHDLAGAPVICGDIPAAS